MTGSCDDATEDLLPRSGSNPQNSNTSSSRGRRSRSSSRRRRCRRFFGSSKHKDSNFLAAFANMIVVVLICTALAEPQWFYIHGGGCRDQNQHSINYLGMSQFILAGQFIKVDSSSENVYTKYEYGTTHKQTLIDCVTEPMVEVMRSLLGVCFLAILMSLFAFLLDLSGAMCKVLRLIREFAIFSIMTVLLCVIVNGFCYWVTEYLEELQKKSKQNKGSKVTVEFSVSFYLMAAAGVMSVTATACNLLRRPYSLRTPAPHSAHSHGAGGEEPSRYRNHPYSRLPPDEPPDYQVDMLMQLGLDLESDVEPLDPGDRTAAAPPPYTP